MITTEQRLALARAVYPVAHSVELADGSVHISYRSPLPLADRSHPVLGLPFEPESNPAQLLDVLCWLLRHRQTPDTEMQVRDDCVASCAFDDEGDAWRVWWIEHNCTPASLSDAVVRAAVRVMEGE